MLKLASLLEKLVAMNATKTELKQYALEIQYLAVLRGYNLMEL